MSCQTCHGTGHVNRGWQGTPVDASETECDCPDCDGTGVDDGWDDDWDAEDMPRPEPEDDWNEIAPHLFVRRGDRRVFA